MHCVMCMKHIMSIGPFSFRFWLQTKRLYILVWYTLFPLHRQHIHDVRCHTHSQRHQNYSRSNRRIPSCDRLLFLFFISWRVYVYYNRVVFFFSLFPLDYNFSFLVCILFWFEHLFRLIDGKNFLYAVWWYLSILFNLFICESWTKSPRKSDCTRTRRKKKKPTKQNHWRDFFLILVSYKL